MKRVHISLSVENVDNSIRFYSGLFGTEPSVRKPDYAKWMLEDPRVNFSISARGRKPGLDHFGIQVESQGELSEVYGRLRAAEGPVLEQGDVTCCYAKSEKSWVLDPQGVAWEAFLTHGESTDYGEDTIQTNDNAACCTPSAEADTAKRCA